jgi:hypothetical protein
MGLLGKHHPLLELEVKVININEGRNAEIASRCKKLSEYSAFISRIHIIWKETGNLEEAVKKLFFFVKAMIY